MAKKSTSKKSTKVVDRKGTVKRKGTIQKTKAKGLGKKGALKVCGIVKNNDKIASQIQCNYRKNTNTYQSSNFHHFIRKNKHKALFYDTPNGFVEIRVDKCDFTYTHGDYYCFNDHEKFSGVPVGLPVKVSKDDTIKCAYYFCDFACMLSYANRVYPHTNIFNNIHALWRVMKKYNLCLKNQPMPKPRSNPLFCLKKFNIGTQSIEEYRSRTTAECLSNVIIPPMISCIIEHERRIVLKCGFIERGENPVRNELSSTKETPINITRGGRSTSSSTGATSSLVEPPKPHVLRDNALSPTLSMQGKQHVQFLPNTSTTATSESEEIYVNNNIKTMFENFY